MLKEENALLVDRCVGQPEEVSFWATSSLSTGKAESKLLGCLY